MKTIQEMLSNASALLRKNGVQEPELDAMVLLSDAMGCAAAGIFMKKNVFLPGRIEKKFRKYLSDRALRRPLPYITGSKEFMGLEFRVAEGVFIPRQETEILVEKVIGLVESTGRPLILDAGTGSGNIAVSVAISVPGACITAVDLSRVAAGLAKKNALRHGVDKRIRFFVSDMLADNFAPAPQGTHFDIIVSNPPYIAGHEFSSLQEEIHFEPRESLDGGADGLRYYRKLKDIGLLYLKPGGYLCVEVGWGQAAAVRKIFKGRCSRFFTVEKTVMDYSGVERVVVAKKNGQGYN
ncbi:MAG: peptide chain release factor N(5)-glutamine methyltransferase [Elusimicrobia bacterium]|nr:peptide chain release factor N(5)-glutamine methyltransferase [Elusimicrobiota bacterium]